MRRISFFLTCFLTIFYQFFAAAEVLNINQNGTLLSYEVRFDRSRTELNFEGAAYPDGLSRLPAMVLSFNTGGAFFEHELIDPVYEKAPANWQPSEAVQDAVSFSKLTAYDRKVAVGKLVIYPYRRNGNNLELLTSFKLRITPRYDQRVGAPSSLSYASHSVLQNGKWYKFGVSKAGIFQLDYNFLKSLGMPVDAISPANIRIFGHEGGMLPERAGEDRTDDLKEYAIKVVSANGSRFQPGDKVLVYCPGPDAWYYDNARQQFKFKKHLYSNTQNLFITADAGPGARVSSVSGTALTENLTVQKYDAIAFYEEEKKNIAQSGRIFLGDEFVDQLSKTYTFSFPDLVAADPLKIDLALAAASEFVGTTFSVSTNATPNARNIFLNRQNVPYPGILDAATWREDNFSLTGQSAACSITLSYNASDFSAKGYLDFINLHARCNLVYGGVPLYFRDITSVGNGRITKFVLQNMNANVEIWDVTNPFNSFRINYALAGSTATFTVATDSLREFIAFESSSNEPVALGPVANQDLHGIPAQDMIIVTRQAFLPQAEELAAFHRNKQGLRVYVAEYGQVLNEFASGANDITAVRNFVKMFYDRAGGNPADMPKYLLLFGDGTYINRDLGEFYLPTYQSQKTFEALETYLSDDYFGLLDDNEGDNVENTSAEIVDIGVGRIPSDNLSKAQVAVDKIKRYYDAASYGEWRNQGTFVGDDEDFNIHIEDADLFAQTFATAMPGFNVDKIYLDAYQQQSGSGGATYPQVNDAIDKKLFTGTLFLNYVGHGGSLGLAAEDILTFSDINKWENPNRLPLFITATCELSRYDEYDKYTAGERIYFKPEGGGIALVTTTRVVFSNRNKEMNRNFTSEMIIAANNPGMALGDIIREAKASTNTGDGNRKFTLLGDPALRLAFPENKVVVTQINQVPVSQPHDTLKSLARISIKGEVRSRADVQLAGFNGVASLTVYDKMKVINTLVNDPESQPFAFDLQKNTIFRGKTRVTNGQFEFNFLVPKDIDYAFGPGKLSLYASSDITDAGGYSRDIIVGGVADTVLDDNDGPEVDVFLNDDNFAFGGITDEDPTLLINLADENGINTSGNGIGHDITAILDNDTRNVLVLNDFYESELDDITQGKVRYPLNDLSAGRHTLLVKAWDILNNSGQGYTEFIVEKSASLALEHVLNYPNPFTTNTTFMFEHNRPDQPLDLRIEIFSVSGKVVKTIQQAINSTGYRVADINWDGRDDFGDKIGKGVYIYRITLRDTNGKKVTKYQKLVLLN